MCSSEGGEFGGSGGTHTDFTVTNRLVSHGVLGKIVTNHVGLDLDGVPVLATVTLNDRIAHLWDNDTVSEMSLDGLRLLTERHILLSQSEFFNETIVLAGDSTLESSPLAGAHEADDFLVGHFEEFVEFVTSVNLLLERLFLGLLSGCWLL